MAFWDEPSYAAFWLDIARGDLATRIQLTPYLYATFEGIHLVAVAFFFGAIFLLDLRLLGVAPPLLAGPAARLLLRISTPAFALLVISGVLLFVPSADRYAASPIFFLKLATIGVGGLNALVFHLTAWRNVEVWNERERTPRAARATAFVSVVVWLSAIALGRAMGYESREPPPADIDMPLFDRLDDSADR